MGIRLSTNRVIKTHITNSIDDISGDPEVTRKINGKKKINIINNVPDVGASVSGASLVSLIPTKSTTVLAEAESMGKAVAKRSSGHASRSSSSRHHEPPGYQLKKETESARLFREEQEHQQREYYKKRVQNARQKQRVAQEGTVTSESAHGGERSSHHRPSHHKSSRQHTYSNHRHKTLHHGSSTHYQRHKTGNQHKFFTHHKYSRYRYNSPHHKFTGRESPHTNPIMEPEKGEIEKVIAKEQLISDDPSSQQNHQRENSFNKQKKHFGNHKQFNNVLSNDVTTFTENSDQAFRSVHRPAVESTSNAKTVSPLVSLGDKAVLRPKTRDKTSTWRTVPKETLNSNQQKDMRYRMLSPRTAMLKKQQDIARKNILEQEKLRKEKEYDEYKRPPPPTLYESEMAMGRIERFLERREHVDKSDFDFLIRSLVEVGRSSTAQDGPYPISKNQIPLQTAPAHQRQQRHENYGASSTYNTYSNPNMGVDNVFPSSGTGRIRGHMETAVNSMNLPTVSVEEHKVLKHEIIQKLHANFKAKYGEIKPRIIERKEEPETKINAENLISSFNGKISNSDSLASTANQPTVELNSLKELPPVSSLPLVTRASSKQKLPITSGDGMLQEIEENMAAVKCIHRRTKGRCPLCNRKPSPRFDRTVVTHGKRKSDSSRNI